MGENDKEIAVLQTEVEGLQKEIASMKTDRQEKDKAEEKRYLRLEEKLDEALRIARGRPTWGVTVLITSLSGLCTALITFIVTTM